MYKKRFSSIDDVQRMVLRYMADARITQKEFAQELGVHEITISRFMQNHTPPPKSVLEWFGLTESIWYERSKK